MTRQETEQVVSQLLFEQRKLRRLDLELPPDELLLLRRLLFRLGLTRMARKRDTDPRAREQELRSWIEAVKPQYQLHGEKQGQFVRDEAAKMGFADWLREATGDPNDPRATVVQNHTNNPKWLGGSPEDAVSGQYLYDLGSWGDNPPPAYGSKLRRTNGLSVQAVSTKVFDPTFPTHHPKNAGTHAIVRWNVALPPRRDSTGRAKPGRRTEFHEFHAVLEPNQLHDLIDRLPEPHRTTWRQYANRFGLTDARTRPEQMSRGRLPRRYAEIGGHYETHNQLIDGIKENVQDANPRLVFADYLQDNNIPGAHVVRAHAQGLASGERSHRPTVDLIPNYAHGHERYDTSPVYGFSPEGRTVGEGEHAFETLAGSPAALGTYLQLFHISPDRFRRGVVVAVNHRKPGAPDQSTSAAGGVTHSALARTTDDVRRLLSDFPQDQVSDIIRTHSRWLRRPQKPEKAVDQAAATRTERLSRGVGVSLKNNGGRQLPVKYAKVDGHVPAHPTVAGFPIEVALRHLANDPKAAPDLRDTAKHVLTTGDTSGLWALHDLVQQHENEDGTTGHPILKAGYNFMSAADKLRLDAKTKTALIEAANDSKVGVPEANHGEWRYSPEYHALRAGTAFEKGDARSNRYLRGSRQLRERIRTRVGQLAPGTDPKLIDESIRRHAYRGNRAYNALLNSQNETDHEERSLKPAGSPRWAGTRFEYSPSDEQERQEKATRYKRLPVKRYAVSGLSNQPFRGGAVPMNPRVTQGSPVSSEEAIRQGLLNSRRQMREHGYQQDVTAGGKLADALDEAGKPHATFFRNLVYQAPNDIRGHETPHGTYRAYLDEVHPLRSAGIMDPDGTRWTTRPAASGPHVSNAVLVNRSVQSSVGRGLKPLYSPTHTAVMRAPELREWASHPGVTPALREHLTRAAEHLEARAGESSGGPARMAKGGSTTVGRSKKAAPLYTYHVSPSGDPERPHKLTVIRRRNQVGWPVFSSNHSTAEGAHKVGRASVTKLLSWLVANKASKNRRKSPVKRYVEAGGYTHADFHAKISENPKDLTSHLVYADWLQEHGQPHAAELIRLWADRQRTLNPSQYRFWTDHGEESTGPASVGAAPFTSADGKFRIGWWIPHPKVARHGLAKDSINLFQRDLSSPDAYHTWSVEIPDHATAKRLVKGMHDEGALADDYDVARASAVPKRGRKKLARRVVRYALANRSNFLDSLRRIKSSNQRAMHQTANQVADQLGLQPTKVLDALHDTPHGSVPGIAQAVYGRAAPEAIHAAAAWIGLTGNLPGVAVFHPRPTGPDTLYRMRLEGSGMDSRVKLDRFGLTNRILVPHRRGFDVLIPDQGNRLGETVENYAKHHGVNLEASPGHFQLVGSADQAKAREMFRNTVSRQEKMMRTETPLRYSQKPFLDKLAKNENDLTTRKVFADWLEDNAPESTTPDVLHRLRNYEGRMWVGLSPKGKVNAIPRLSKEVLEAKARENPWGVPSGEFYHSTSRNNSGRAHRVRVSGKMKLWKTRPDEFRVPWKHGLYDNGEFNHRNVHEWLTDDPTAEPT